MQKLLCTTEYVYTGPVNIIEIQFVLPIINDNFASWPEKIAKCLIPTFVRNIHNIYHDIFRYHFKFCELSMRVTDTYITFYTTKIILLLTAVYWPKQFHSRRPRPSYYIIPASYVHAFTPCLFYTITVCTVRGYCKLSICYRLCAFVYYRSFLSHGSVHKLWSVYVQIIMSMTLKMYIFIYLPVQFMYIFFKLKF